MNDLMTPVLPAVGGSVGKNGLGSPTAFFGAMSTIEARASFLRGMLDLLPISPEGLRSTPFVASVAAQLAAQL